MNPKATRERLLTAAAQLLATKGYEDISLRELTQAAGTNLGAVNYHFGNKESLFATLQQQAAAALNEQRLNQLAAISHTNSNPQTLAREIIRALLAPVSESNQGQSLLPISTEVADNTPGDNGELLTAFSDALAPILPEVPPALIRWRLYCILTLEGALRQAEAMPPPLATNPIEAMLDFVTHGLFAKP